MMSELRTLEQVDEGGVAAAAERFHGHLVGLMDATDGPVLISQDRCVDGLLDLYNAAPTEVVRAMVASVIDDIRHLSAVRSVDLAERLLDLRAAVAVESALFD